MKKFSDFLYRHIVNTRCDSPALRILLLQQRRTDDFSELGYTGMSHLVGEYDRSQKFLIQLVQPVSIRDVQNIPAPLSGVDAIPRLFLRLCHEDSRGFILLRRHLLRHDMLNALVLNPHIDDILCVLRQRQVTVGLNAEHQRQNYNGDPVGLQIPYYFPHIFSSPFPLSQHSAFSASAASISCARESSSVLTFSCPIRRKIPRKNRSICDLHCPHFSQPFSVRRTSVFLRSPGSADLWVYPFSSRFRRLRETAGGGTGSACTISDTLTKSLSLISWPIAIMVCRSP